MPPSDVMHLRRFIDRIAFSSTPTVANEAINDESRQSIGLMLRRAA
jgi:hypothetical protein